MRPQVSGLIFLLFALCRGRLEIPGNIPFPPFEISNSLFHPFWLRGALQVVVEEFIQVNGPVFLVFSLPQSVFFSVKI